MAEDNTGTMNFDLNLGPRASNDDSERGSGYYHNATMNLEEWLYNPNYRVGDAVHQRDHRRRSRWRQVPIPPETENLSLELTGEGSIGPEERPSEVVKKCDNCNDSAEDESLGKKEDAHKYSGDEGSFFDCHICLDLAKDPVVTCCGHLFCWPCLYKWLHLHSDAKECPVCKGEVTVKSVTPIYGRGNNNKLGVDANSKIPLRPRARRVESWRQSIQRASFTIPMEEMIRRLGSTYDSSQDLAPIQSRDSEASRESPDRGSSLLTRILTSRAIRQERPHSAHTNDDVIDLTETGPTNYEGRDTRRLSSRSIHRSISIRGTSLSSLTSTLSPADTVLAERLVESYFRPNVLERDQEFLPPVDDRDSVSSIAATIHSESQTVDNTIEIDSTLYHSTLSSRRRNDVSRISDVDSGNSHVPRRRRLN